MFQLDGIGGVFLQEGGKRVPDAIVGSYPGVLVVGADTLPVCHVFCDTGEKGAIGRVASSLESCRERPAEGLEDSFGATAGQSIGR